MSVLYTRVDVEKSAQSSSISLSNTTPLSGMLHHQKRGHHPLENKAYIAMATNRLIYRKLYACVGRRYFTDVHPWWKDHLPFGRRGCQSGESCISRRIWLSGTGIEYFRVDASPLSQRFPVLPRWKKKCTTGQGKRVNGCNCVDSYTGVPYFNGTRQGHMRIKN